jgi:hypothetical protein
MGRLWVKIHVSQIQLLGTDVHVSILRLRYRPSFHLAAPSSNGKGRPEVIMNLVADSIRYSPGNPVSGGANIGISLNGIFIVNHESMIPLNRCERCLICCALLFLHHFCDGVNCMLLFLFPCFGCCQGFRTAISVTASRQLKCVINPLILMLLAE